VTTAEERLARRRRRRRAAALRWTIRLATAAIVFGIGVAVGEALHDNPKPGPTVTSIRTIHAP
jgi:anti-sigma factor RsiW